MATAQEIAGWAAGAEARGVIPHRPIGPPDWQAKGTLLSFILVQGFSNEHQGALPPSDGAFRDWVAAPYVNNPALRRYWPPGSQDVKTDGSVAAPPWDWNPMGCPGGNGCNDDDWQNHAPWPAAAVAVAPIAPVAAPIGGSGGGVLSPAPFSGGGITLPLVGSVSPVVLGVAALGGVLILSRLRR